MLTRTAIATKIGLNAKQFRELVEPRPDFPRPALRLSRKTVLWDARDVDRWLAAQRQLASA